MMHYAPDVVVRSALGCNYVWHPLTQRGRDALNLTESDGDYWCPQATSELLFTLLRFELIIIGDVVGAICASCPTTEDCIAFVGSVS